MEIKRGHNFLHENRSLPNTLFQSTDPIRTRRIGCASGVPLGIPNQCQIGTPGKVFDGIPKFPILQLISVTWPHQMYDLYHPWIQIYGPTINQSSNGPKIYESQVGLPAAPSTRGEPPLASKPRRPKMLADESRERN